jgi:hypothetical protein
MPKLLSGLILFCILHSVSWGNDITKLTDAEGIGEEKKLSEFLNTSSFITTGEATFSVLFWDLYKSRLKTTSGKYPISFAKDQLIFEIEYFADISKEDLIKRTVEQWQHQNIPKEAYQPYISQLNSIWPAITEGDSLAILVKKDSSIFYFNNQRIGIIEDNFFGRLFIDIWLNKKTSQPSLRKQLLGDNYNE